MELFSRAQTDVMLMVFCGRYKNCWKEAEHGSDVANSAKKKGRPRRSNANNRSIVSRLHAERKAKVYPQAVQSETELFKKFTTAKEADEKNQTKEKHSLEKITAWSYDRSCRKTRGEIMRRCVFSWQHHAWTITKIPLQDYETTGELSAV